jgi:hypothetical protein
MKNKQAWESDDQILEKAGNQRKLQHGTSFIKP